MKKGPPSVNCQVPWSYDLEGQIWSKLSRLICYGVGVKTRPISEFEAACQGRVILNIVVEADNFVYGCAIIPVPEELK